MKTVTRAGLVVLLLASAAFVFAQATSPPGFRRGGPPVGEEGGEEGRPRPAWAPRGEAGRYVIVSLGSGSLMLDSATGDSWSFVPDDSIGKGRWEPVTRKMLDRRGRSERGESEGPRNGRSGEAERGN